MKILLIAVGMLQIPYLMSQDFELIPYRKGELWGFADSAKNIVIKPKYEDVLPFNKGFSAYKASGKWGLLNTKGNKLTKPVFDSTGEYFHSYMEVGENEEMKSFVGLYVCQETNCFLVDSTGTSPSKNTLIEQPPPMRRENGTGAGLYEITAKNGLVGIRFLKQNKRIEPQYDSIIFVKSTIYGQDDYIFAQKNNLWAIVSMTNESLTEFVYQALQVSREGFSQILFKQENKWGILDNINEVQLNNSYDSIVTVFNKYLVKQKGKWGVIDYRYQTVVPTIYADIDYSPDGYYVRNKKNKIGYINEKGVEIIPMKYTYLEQCKKWHHKHLFKYRTTKSNRTGCLNIKNNISIPEKYITIEPYANGYFRVTTMKGKTGFINQNDVQFFED